MKVNDSETSSVKENVAQSSQIKQQPILFGFGGWLIVFSLGLAYQFFMNLKAFYDNYLLLNSEEMSYLTDKSSEGYNSLWEPAIIFECITQLIAVIFVIFIAYFCLKMDYKFKLLTLIYIPLLLVFNLASTLLMLNIQNYYTETIYTSEDLYYNLYKSGVYAVVWIPYFLISKRVNNTFVKKSKVSS